MNIWFEHNTKTKGTGFSHFMGALLSFSLQILWLIRFCGVLSQPLFALSACTRLVIDIGAFVVWNSIRRHAKKKNGKRKRYWWKFLFQKVEHRTKFPKFWIDNFCLTKTLHEKLQFSLLIKTIGSNVPLKFYIKKRIYRQW